LPAPKYEKARWWSKEGVSVRCHLCPHACIIGNNGTGICGVRINMEGQLYSTNYGKVCVAAVDQIEKKPMFHYRPGSYLYSVGTFGCNLDCANCQNFQLARGSASNTPFESITPEALLLQALAKEVDGIGWTFNEPIVWSEFLIDASVLAKKKELYTMMNTNGFIQKGAREELFTYIDAIKIDIKGFTEGFYEKYCNGRLGPVLDTCVAAKEAGIHVEIAYLLMPEINDSEEEIQQFAKWVLSKMGQDTPVHFFRFSPAYKLSHLNQESMAKMASARSSAIDCGLHYVYYGGTISTEEQNTRCPKCGELLISRKGKEPSEKLFVKKSQVSRFCPTFSDVDIKMHDGKCSKCGTSVSILLK